MLPRKYTEFWGSPDRAGKETDLEKEIFEAEGTRWSERAKLGFKGVLDPGDGSGRKNLYMDIVGKQALRKYLGLTGREVVLDFGCGVGRITSWIADGALKVIGLDVSKEMIEKAKKNTSHPKVEYIHFDGENIPFEDGHFDLAISVNVLMYPIRDSEIFTRITRDIARVIKKGGRLVMIETAYHNSDGRIFTKEDYIRRFSEEHLKLKTCYATRDGKASPVAELAYRGLLPAFLYPSLARAERWLIRSQAKQMRRLLQGSYVEYLFEFEKALET